MVSVLAVDSGFSLVPMLLVPLLPLSVLVISLTEVEDTETLYSICS